MKSALLFKLPFRILALPIVILLFGLEGILNVAENISGFFIGLYNLLLVAILCLIIYNKEWNQMWGFSIMVVVEGILLAAVGVAHNARWHIIVATCLIVIRFVDSFSCAYFRFGLRKWREKWK